MTRKFGSATAVFLLVTLALASPALATQRFAIPTGGASTGTCAPPDPPCTLQWAVEGTSTGDFDEVIVAPGDYMEGSNQLVVSDAIDLHGVAGQPTPRIVTTASDAVRVAITAGAATLHRLTIDHAVSGNGLLIENGTVEQVVVRSTRSACRMNAFAEGPFLRDSVCWTNNPPPGNSALFVTTTGDGFAGIRNVTAIGTGSSTQGIFVWGNGSSANLTLEARNVIARGGAPNSDVWAEADPGATATVTLDYSNYATQNETGTGTSSVTDPGTGTNQTSSPAFADPANGDFHQLAGSPTIDAGTSAATVVGTLGTLDFDGDPRTLGAAPDIGADEFVPPAPQPEPEVGDTTAPDTTITKKPKDKTKKKTATFEFTSTEPGSTFECSLDGKTFAPCASPDTVKVKRGKHSFQVRATDAAGNVDPTPASDAWKVKKKRRR